MKMDCSSWRFPMSLRFPVALVVLGVLSVGGAAIGGAAFGGTAFGGTAFAQDTSVSGQLESAEATTPKQKMEFAASALTEMESADKAVRKMLETAEKDAGSEGADQKIQCLKNKLASIRALEEVSAGASVSMQEALGGNQNELADFHFRKIAVAISKVRQFLAEAEACMGVGGVTGGTESVDVTGDLTGEGFGDLFDNDIDALPDVDITPFD
jgi:hypothetical protein